VRSDRLLIKLALAYASLRAISMALPAIPSVATAALTVAALGSQAVGESAKFAGLLRDKLQASQWSPGSGRTFQLPDGTPVEIGQARTSVTQTLAQIQSQLTTLLSQNGISPAGGATIQVDATGGSHVVAPQSQQAVIQSILSANPQLQSLLSSAATNSRVLQAVKGIGGSGPSAQQAFQTAFTNLSGPATTFTLLVTPQSTQVSFGPAQPGV
jgi:hypothetical protein